MSAVAVVGAGSIGVAWSIVFAQAGMTVRVSEPDAGRREAVPKEVEARLNDLAGAGLLDEDPSAVAARITVMASTEEAVADVIHVQECAPESLELKRALFAELDASVSPLVPIATSSSAITASAIASELEHRERCLVLHPGNPPFLLPVVELVPAPFTAEWAIEQCEHLMRAAGRAPVRVRVELEGFVFNRLQGAVLREAYCLVRDGVVSPRELDSVVTNGLGRRWAVIGPFATADLNTRGGIEQHAKRLGSAYARMGAERGQDDPWTDDLVQKVAADLHQDLAPADWDDNVRARDRALMALERCRREHDTILRSGGAES